jgi:hypothetical protein
MFEVAIFVRNTQVFVVGPFEFWDEAHSFGLGRYDAHAQVDFRVRPDGYTSAQHISIPDTDVALALLCA